MSLPNRPSPDDSIANDERAILGKLAIRRTLGLTQEQLAEKADLHWTYVSGIERDQKNISIVNLHQIAIALRLRVRDLVKDF